MIARIIALSAKHRGLVIVLYGVLVAFAIAAAKHVQLDATPDLSDPQVIVFTEWKGQSPTIIEDQITYPIASALLAAPKVAAVRGYSMFGMSFLYVLFEENTDIYWARSRVLEYLSSARARLPEAVTPVLGPDATGVGWLYEYALVDRTGSHDLADLRALQDYTLRYALESVPGVAQVASVGGFERQYQVTIDPDKLRAFGVTVTDVGEAIRRSNGEVGGRVLEMSGREYFIRGRGYLQNLADVAGVAIRAGPDGTPVRVGDVATVRFGGDIRRGLAELNGEGETVGAIVIARYGENARDVIDRVRAKLDVLRPSLPAGVEIVPTYDRSSLIDRAVATLKHVLVEEALTVSAVILLFLLHLRSALLPIISLPIAVLLTFIPMYLLGIPATIMSLGGIAIAIGATVDAEIVMVEACHKKLENAPKHIAKADRERLLQEAAQEITPALFFSLLIIALSFIPVFALNGEAGRLFKPLAYAKTFVMFSAAIVSITLAPALRNALLQGTIRSEQNHPVSRLIQAVYRPFVYVALRRPLTTLSIGVLAIASAIPAYLRLGHEFMPPLNEGDILYMPTTLPNLSIEEAKRQLERQDRALAAFPEVKTVFGKIGRAESPTDPAPLSMVETVIQLAPASTWPRVARKRWHSGIAPAFARPALRRLWPEDREETWDDLVAKMNATLQMPGWVNAWTMPIRARLDMLTTGVRTPVGIKIFGDNLSSIDAAGQSLEAILRAQTGARNVLYERSLAGSYIDITPRREGLARYGLQIDDLNGVIERAIGGEPVTTVVDGRKRFSVNVRYKDDFRASLEALRETRVPLHPNLESSKPPTSIALGELADIRIVEGPPMIREEAGMLVGYVYVDLAPDHDIGSFVDTAKGVVSRAQATGSLRIGSGMYLKWAGQYELLEAMRARMNVLIPLALIAVAALLYLQFKNLTEVLIVFLSIPFAVVGGVWLLYLLDYRISTAVLVGFLALIGLAAQTGVVMIVYIDHAFERRVRAGKLRNLDDIIHAHTEGTVLRVRPKLMTIGTMLIGLVPVLWATGSGADVMKRIAAPMVGGLLSSAFLTLEMIPVVYTYWRYAQLKKAQRTGRSVADVCGIDIDTTKPGSRPNA